MSKRIVIGDNELFRRLHPILLEIFSRGVLAESSKRLVLVAMTSILLTPFPLPIIIFKKFIHLAIIFTAYLLLRVEITQLGITDKLFIVTATIAVYYKDIYELLLDVFINFLIVVTGGVFLRWICRGYLSGTGFRQNWLTSGAMERVVGALVEGMSTPHVNQYRQMMRLYLESNNPENEKRLNNLIEEYNNRSVSVHENRS